MKHIPALDSLRGIAVLLVVFHHFKYLGVGWIGVQIFFVLSGFLITSILLERKEEDLGRYLGRFYWRRILRIFPVYYGFLIAVSVAYLTVGEPVAFGDLAPWLFSYTYNIARFFEPDMTWPYFGHLWSLAIEEQFYLVWPFVVYGLSRKNFQKLTLALVILGPILRWIMGAYFLDEGYSPSKTAQCVYTLPTSHLDAFAVGAVLSVSGRDWLEKPNKWLVGVFLTTLVLGAYQWGHLDPHRRLFTDFGYPIYLSESYQYIWGYTAINLLGGGLVLYAVRGGVFIPGSSSAVLQFYGRISYGLYVLHWPVLGAIRRVHDFRAWSLEGFMIFVLFFFGSTFLAWFSYRFYESWFTRLKDR